MSIVERRLAPSLDVGQLAGNGMQVKMLQSALSHSEMNARTLPRLILNIHRARAWERYLFADDPGRVFDWTSPSSSSRFREFVEAPRSEGGCQTPLHVLERILRPVEDRDSPPDPIRAEAWAAFNEMMRGKPGGLQHDNRNDEGRFVSHKYDNVILVDEPPATIPIPESRKPPCGNSTSYVLRQLANGRKLKTGDVIPARPDLLERVRTGELTPHAAAVLAGFDTKSITIPAEPAAAARRLLRHFRGEALETLIRELRAHE